MMLYGRPSKKEKYLLAKRKEIIVNLLRSSNFTQSEIAFMFRLPRNTVYNIKKSI